MKKTLIFSLLVFGIYSQSRGQLVVSSQQLERYMREAKDRKPMAYIVYKSGDTLSGSVIDKKRNKMSGKVKWTMDGKPVDSLPWIRVYQDEIGYVYCYPYDSKSVKYSLTYGTEFGRVYKGKVSLFMTRVAQTEREQRTDRRTYFFLSDDPTKFVNMSPVTPKQLEDMVKDYPPALEKLNAEFGTVKDKETNDYNKVIAVLKVYDQKK